jgi:superfamily II DNA or RNA helicase
MRLRDDIQPREWQRNALTEWVAAGQRGIVAVVTGGGKTVFAHMCMDRVLSENENAVILVVVPTTALMDQWAADLAYAFEINLSAVACWGGGEKPRTSLATINVMVVNTASKIIPTINETRPILIIADECHRIATASFQHAVPAKTNWSLGLSATPERDHDQGFEDILVPKLGPIVFRYTYTEAQRDGVITPLDLVNIRLSMTEDEQHEFTKLSKRIAIARQKQDPEETIESLLRRRAAIYINAESRVPWALKLSMEHPSDRIIIFHERLEPLKVIIKALEARGIAALAYDSSLAGPLRRSNLWMFRKGIVRCLATCRALDEGANIPEANVAIIASASSSSRQRIQRLGRVLRPAKGKTKALVYTFYTTDIEARRLEDEAASMNSVATVRWAIGSRRAHSS